MTGWGGRRRIIGAMAEITVQPLTLERFADLAQLFEQGGDPKWCWCTWWRVPSANWSNTTAAQNRERLERLTASGPAPGLIAYRDDEAVGWVSLGPRTDYERLERSRTLPRVDDEPVWAIVCFVVGRPARRTGVARVLLEAAVDYARRQGAPALEAYPIDPGEARVPAAAGYTGTRGMFERAGFTVVAPTGSKSGGAPRVVMRRIL